MVSKFIGYTDPKTPKKEPSAKEVLAVLNEKTQKIIQRAQERADAVSRNNRNK
ncbi:MAG: hypothetical protein HC836_30365 [Richelia sp. RM2_1_2]|nr:hypothetical protein [Richelia sp. RM2_1_2]